MYIVFVKYARLYITLSRDFVYAVCICNIFLDADCMYLIILHIHYCIDCVVIRELTLHYLLCGRSIIWNAFRFINGPAVYSDVRAARFNYFRNGLLTKIIHYNRLIKSVPKQVKNLPLTIFVLRPILSLILPNLLIRDVQNRLFTCL